MSGKKIIEGLNEALAHARGEDTGASVRLVDLSVEDISRINLTSFVSLPMIAIIEKDGEWQVYEQTASGVFPTSSYSTKRAAASRVLQLLGIGPVAPQTHPETVGIGAVK